MVIRDLSKVSIKIEEVLSQLASGCRHIELTVGQKWPFAIYHTARADIQACCISADSDDWQKVRLFMKGKNTNQKLYILQMWLDFFGRQCGYTQRAVEVQVDNYINAIKRGGQLSIENKVQR